MCQLFAASFNKKLNITYSFRGFRTRGEGNPHGWGLAWYPDSAVQIMKEPVKAGESQLADFLQNYSKVRSQNFIGHVRWGNVGGINHSNTHPFGREYNGIDYSFAHNGTVSTDNLSKDNFKPVGSTDSERAFCHLMDIIKEEIDSRIEERHFELIGNTLRNINENGNFNCIFSDGNYLFCYHDINQYNGLCYLKREAPFQNTRYLDEEIEVDFSAHKAPDQKGFVIATSPLTDENWTNFRGGELLVFRNGEKIYSSISNDSSLSSLNLTKTDLVILSKIRESQNRVSIQEIYSNLALSRHVVIKSIEKLIHLEFIRQDRRDSFSWDNKFSTYYTLRKSRSVIDNQLASYTPPLANLIQSQKVTWLEDVLECLKYLGGEAHLSDIYHWFELNRSHRIKKGAVHTGIIRRTLQQQSSDCDAFLGKKDLFTLVAGKGRGLWAIKERNKRKLWTEEEINIAVDAYCDMLEMEESEIKYNKSEIYRILTKGPNPSRTNPPGLLANRTSGSVEMRMCNISAVLHDNSKSFIPGLKPLKNVGKNNYNFIEKRLRECNKI